VGGVTTVLERGETNTRTKKEGGSREGGPGANKRGKELQAYRLITWAGSRPSVRSRRGRSRRRGWWEKERCRGRKGGGKKTRSLKSWEKGRPTVFSTEAISRGHSHLRPPRPFHHESDRSWLREEELKGRGKESLQNKKKEGGQKKDVRKILIVTRKTARKNYSSFTFTDGTERHGTETT